jgi:signal transduction histidine kinase
MQTQTQTQMQMQMQTQTQMQTILAEISTTLVRILD